MRIQKGAISILFTFLAIVGFFAYEYYTRLEPTNQPQTQVQQQNQISNQNSTKQTPSGQTGVSTGSWKTYTNEQKKISLKYPSNAKISEIKGDITFGLSIDMPENYTLHFFKQAVPDDYSTNKVYSENKIMVAGRQVFSRVYDDPSYGDVSVIIEIKRYLGSDNQERSDSFIANFQNINEANAALPEIETIAETLKYL